MRAGQRRSLESEEGRGKVWNPTTGRAKMGLEPGSAVSEKDDVGIEGVCGIVV